MGEYDAEVGRVVGPSKVEAFSMWMDDGRADGEDQMLLSEMIKVRLWSCSGTQYVEVYECLDCSSRRELALLDDSGFVRSHKLHGAKTKPVAAPCIEFLQRVDILEIR